MLQYPKFQHSVNLTSPDRPAHRVRGQYLARAHLSRRQRAKRSLMDSEEVRWQLEDELRELRERIARKLDELVARLPVQIAKSLAREGKSKNKRT